MACDRRSGSQTVARGEGEPPVEAVFAPSLSVAEDDEEEAFLLRTSAASPKAKTIRIPSTTAAAMEMPIATLAVGLMREVMK